MTAAYNAKAVCVFTRDVDSGMFSGVQTFSDTDRLDGVTALRLSPNGRYGATAGPWTTGMFIEAVYKTVPRGGTK